MTYRSPWKFNRYDDGKKENGSMQRSVAQEVPMQQSLASGYMRDAALFNELLENSHPDHALRFDEFISDV